MTGTYTAIPDLTAAIEIPPDGTLSRTVYSDATIKVVAFGFDAGQELSEHTAARPAIVQILRGEAHITLGADVIDAQPGTWVHMQAGQPHGIRAVTPMVMLLTLL